MRSGSSSGKTLKAMLRYTILIMMAAIAVMPASAQSTETKGRAERLESESMRLLDELVTEAGAIENQEVRVKLLVEALEIYWDRDNTKARNLLNDLTIQIVALLIDAARENRQNMEFRFRAGSNVKEIRERILLFLSGKDTRSALQFLQATRQPVRLGSPDEDAALEMQMAARIASQDPETAYRIAEGKLDKNLHPQVTEIFKSLVRDSPAHALRLGGEMNSKLRSSVITENYQSINFILNMVEALNTRLEKGASGAPPLNERDTESFRQLLRETLEILVRNVLTITPAGFEDNSKADTLRFFMIRINEWYSAVDKYLPNRSAAVRARVRQIQSLNGKLPQNMLIADFEKQVEGKSVDVILEMAGSAPEEARRTLYQKALEQAIEEGDQETAVKIASEKLEMSDDGPGSQYSIRRRAAEQAVKKRKYEQALQMLPPDIPDDEKANLLSRWAAAATEAGSPGVAKELIERARALVGQRTESRKDLETQVSIALAAIETDPDHGFETAGIAIERLNRLIASVLDFVKFESMVRDEFPLEIVQQTGQLNQNLVSLLSRLAAVDFQRTENLLGRWQAREMRIMIGFNVIRKILIGEQAVPRENSGGM
ncbi:MAG: hypothetical protein AB7H86_18110 [Blastocatellales bacterium]